MAKIKNIIIDYDRDGDILNIVFGDKAKEAISIEKDEEVFLRVTLDSKEIVGMTILGFKKYILGEEGKGISFSRQFSISEVGN